VTQKRLNICSLSWFFWVLSPVVSEFQIFGGETLPILDSHSRASRKGQNPSKQRKSSAPANVSNVKKLARLRKTAEK
jgi:hypothetical protein